MAEQFSPRHLSIIRCMGGSNQTRYSRFPPPKYAAVVHRRVSLSDWFGKGQCINLRLDLLIRQIGAHAALRYSMSVAADHRDLHSSPARRSSDRAFELHVKVDT